MDVPDYNNTTPVEAPYAPEDALEAAKAAFWDSEDMKEVFGGSVEFEVSDDGRYVNVWLKADKKRLQCLAEYERGFDYD